MNQEHYICYANVKVSLILKNAIQIKSQKGDSNMNQCKQV